MSYKIIDNFLDQESFLLIQETLFGPEFPWYFQQGVSYRHEFGADYLHNFQFTHLFWNATDTSVKSHWFSVLDPLIEKIKPAAVLRIKANLMPVTATRIVHKMHVDVDVHCKTAILYLNNNNGATIFENGTEIESVENRLVIFDSRLQHTSASCTDKKARCVININYLEGILCQ
jgi:hypothetical protein